MSSPLPEVIFDESLAGPAPSKDSTESDPMLQTSWPAGVIPWPDASMPSVTGVFAPGPPARPERRGAPSPLAARPFLGSGGPDPAMLKARLPLRIERRNPWGFLITVLVSFGLGVSSTWWFAVRPLTEPPPETLDRQVVGHRATEESAAEAVEAAAMEAAAAARRMADQATWQAVTRGR